MPSQLYLGGRHCLGPPYYKPKFSLTVGAGTPIRVLHLQPTSYLDMHRAPSQPWLDTSGIFLTDFPLVSAASVSRFAARQAFQTLIDSTFKGHSAINRDGSRITAPTVSCSAAVVAPSKGISLNWNCGLVWVSWSVSCSQSERLVEGATNNSAAVKSWLFSHTLWVPRGYIQGVYSTQILVVNLSSGHDLRL